MSNSPSSTTNNPTQSIDNSVSKIKKSEAFRDLNRLSSRFLLQLDALLETANRIMLITARSQERAQRELDDFMSPLIAENSDGKTLMLRAPSPEYQKFQKLNKAAGKAAEALRLVPRSFMVSMVTQYDTFLAETVRRLFKLKPERVRTAESSMKVKDIVRFASMEELLQRLIDDEIDDALRGSHNDQLEWIAKRFDFTVDPKDSLIQRFIELTERRNAYVHTDGIINRQYISVCASLPDSIVSNRTLGNRLPLGRAYLAGARDTLFEVGIRVQQIAWRKQRDDQRDAQDSALNEVIFDLLSREDYRLARNLADFGSSLRNYASERSKRLLAINQAQAYKWGGKEDEAIKIIDQTDWTSTSANFKVAVAVLKNDFVTAARWMPHVPTSPEDEDCVPAEAYRTWPLFKEARSQKPILDAFEKIFGEPLVTETISVPTAAKLEETPNVSVAELSPAIEESLEAQVQSASDSEVERIGRVDHI